MGGIDQERGAPQQSARALVTRALDRQLNEIVDEAHASVFEIPAYRRHNASPLPDDVGEHIEAHFKTALEIYAAGRPPTREDVVPIRPRATRRVAMGISVADFIHAFEASEGRYVHRVLQFADDKRLSPELPSLIMNTRQYFYMATVEAAEVYLEEERLRAASGEGIRRDLLDDLLAGRLPPAGPALDAARDAGLDTRSSCVVVVALLTTPADDYALRSAAATLARATGSPLQPLVVARRDDIVVVLPAPNDGIEALATRLEEAQHRLATHGLAFAVGISTVHEGLESVADAYKEAAGACERLLPSPGVVVLPTMSTFDYLVWRGDGTARHLIRPSIGRFVAQDLNEDGALIDTLRVYFEADLNATRTAERLHLHVNTVYYRLTKIADSSDCDVRRVSDVVEILIAARLLGAA